MNQEENLLAAAKSLLLGWGMVLTYVLFNSFGTFFFKTEVQKLGAWPFSTFQSVFSYFLALFSTWKTWVGLASISIATGAWIMALSHLELSKTYPVAIGLNLLIIVGISAIYFQEPITFSKVLGTFLIFSGTLFLFR